MTARARHPVALASRGLRRFERAIGADVENRSLWVWAIPAGTATVTFAMCGWMGLIGGLGIAGSLALAIFLSAFMFTFSAVNLTSAGADDRDAEAPELPVSRHPR